MLASIPQRSCLSRLDDDDRHALLGRFFLPQRYAVGRVILEAHESSRGVCLIRSGIACRYVVLRTGQRQILGFLLPGDLFDVRACFADYTDFIVEGLSSIELVALSRYDLMDLVGARPGLARELWRIAAIEDATARQWMLNVGHRNAQERVAHLLCECFTRLQALGLAADNSYLLPITQRDLADALALSAVHVNRTLMKLRRQGLIQTAGHRITIPDLEALRDAAGFDAGYLQIGSSADTAQPDPLSRPPPLTHPSDAPAQSNGAHAPHDP